MGDAEDAGPLTIALTGGPVHARAGSISGVVDSGTTEFGWLEIVWQRCRLVETQLAPTAVATFEERVKLENPLARDLPRSFVRCSEFPTFSGTEAKALENGWKIDQLACGHFAQLEQPEKLASLLIG
jgi:hypothetical protein